MFDRQKILQMKIEGVQLPVNSPQLFKKYALGIFTELGEALAVNKNWKDWRQQREYDEDDLLEEIADIWIFLVNYTMANGKDLDEMLDCIEAKQKILAERHNVDFGFKEKEQKDG